MERIRKIKNRYVGDGNPTLIIAEIGINHNGSLELAKKLIQGAFEAGVDVVKFQKRTPELCVPKDQWDLERDTPWGRIPYIEYRHKIEFGEKEYDEIDAFCNKLGIMWTASAWDIPSVDFLERYDIPFHKAPSAMLTDIELLKRMQKNNHPLIISTGMSEMEQIEKTVSELNYGNLLIAHSTSTYPCKTNELNLKVIPTLRNKYPDIPIGYSGHETGLVPTWTAVALGANFIERHITLDRAMWGTDQSASVEVEGFSRLVRNISDIELALGDGVKKVYDSEKPFINKLRKIK